VAGILRVSRLDRSPRRRSATALDEIRRSSP
jgi:hypothetical protein